MKSYDRGRQRYLFLMLLAAIAGSGLLQYLAQGAQENAQYVLNLRGLCGGVQPLFIGKGKNMSEYRSYTEQMTVLDGDSDFRRCLKPSALFRYVEQVSADHARAYGMDHAFFRERHNAFLVGKQASGSGGCPAVRRRST